MKIIKRYKFFIATIIILTAVFMINNETGKKSLNVISFSLKEMIFIIPPVFILLGLLDVWVPKEIMMKYMGQDSGVKGSIMAFVLGSATAGPLYGAFPVAAVFMKKGVKLFNVLVFIGAWSTTKIPMFLFELSSLGTKFALTRFFVNIPGILIISYIICKMISEEDKENVYLNAEKF